MHPIICKIGPFTLYSYGLMLVLAFIIGSLLASRQAKREKINPEIILNLCFIAFICGIVGARIFYIFENLSYYLRNPAEIIMLQRGGLSWFGGLIMGGLAGVFYLRRRKLKIYKIFDIIAPYLALAQSIGRFGCLLNGCCYGKASVKFGIYFVTHNAVLIPTQLYSSLTLIFIFIILKIFQDRPHQEGQIFFLYLLLYSIKRFFIEFWRADNPVIFLGLTLFQILSILVFCLSFFKLVAMIRARGSK
jgi:phosphatidylglycerol:prolipoprotein diacylglycerol transferase